MTDTEILLTDLAFPESPRWHEGRIHVSDWGAGQVHRVGADGRDEVVATGSSFPMCIDFLPDGRLLVVHGPDLLVREPDGTLAPYADLRPLSEHAYNDITVDGRGTVFVNNIGFDFPGGEPRPGIVVAVTPDGSAREVADDVLFPNGMAVIDKVLVVAESYRNRLTAFDIAPDGSLSGRRVWADLGDDYPDGISADPDGRIWYADVPHQVCRLVEEGGRIVRTVELDRGAFSCAVADGVLYVATNEWTGAPTQGRNGQLVAVDLSTVEPHGAAKASVGGSREARSAG